MAATANSASRAGEQRIRRGAREDVEALARLINAAFAVEQVAFDGDRVDAQGVRVYTKTGTFLIAEDAAGLAGCVYIETRGERSYLGLLSVEPKRQGCGLGRKLVAEGQKFPGDAGRRAVGSRRDKPGPAALVRVYLRPG